MKNTTFNNILALITEQVKAGNCSWDTDGWSAEQISKWKLDPTRFLLAIPFGVFKSRVGLTPYELGEHYIREVLPSLLQKRLCKPDLKSQFGLWVSGYEGAETLMVAGRTDLPELLGNRAVA